MGEPPSPAADPPPPPQPLPEAAAELPPHLRLLERLVALGLMVLVMWGVSLKLEPSEALPIAPPDESLQRLQGLMGGDGARLLGALLVVFAIGVLGLSLFLLPRMMAAFLRALGDTPPGPHPLRLRTSPLWIAHFLLAAGLAILGEGACGLIGREPPRLVTPGSEAVQRLGSGLRLGADGVLPADSAADARVRLRWAGASGLLEVAHGDGAAVWLESAEGRVSLAPGTVVSLEAGNALGVGSFAARVEAPGWPEILARSAAGKLLALLGLLGLCGFLGGRAVLRAAGVVREGLGRELLRGALAYLAFLPVYALALLATQWLSVALDLPTEGHPLVRVLERDGSALLWGLVVLQAVFFAPILEELLIRGFALCSLGRVMRPLGAVIATALIFAVMHSGFSSLLPMFALGVLFAGLRLTGPRGSLAAPVSAHFLHNALTLSLVLALQLAR